MRAHNFTNQTRVKHVLAGGRVDGSSVRWSSQSLKQRLPVLLSKDV